MENATTSVRTKTSTRRRSPLSPEQLHAYLSDLFGDDLHAKRVLSLRNGILGVLHSAALGVHAIGLGLAAALSLTPKHAIKQVDRLLSNPAFCPWDLFEPWVLFVLAQRKEVVIAIDWTDFAADDHTTCSAHLVTAHGRATPLVWKTIQKSELAGQRAAVEDQVINRLQQIIPPEVAITLLADRGFGDQRRYDMLDAMGWDFVIRFKGNILVQDQHGTTKPASEWLHPTGRPRILRQAKVTGEQMPVGAVVVVKAKGMKEAWYLATSHKDKRASQVIKLYGRRFTIEESYRDSKDSRYGLGLSAVHIQQSQRRDRMWMLGVVAQALLTVLGAAAEEVGLDRLFKRNTVTRRTYSLFRQGSYWYGCIPNMREQWLRPLMEAFDRLLSGMRVFQEVFGVI
jgi:hypothetical protein